MKYEPAKCYARLSWLIATFRDECPPYTRELIGLVGGIVSLLKRC